MRGVVESVSAIVVAVTVRLVLPIAVLVKVWLAWLLI